MTNEFKKVKNDNETRYVLETATAGATSAGVVATAPGKKREDSILAQEANKKKETDKPRNFVAKNAKMGGAGAHKDKKKEQKQGAAKHKKPFMEEMQTRLDQLKSRLEESERTMSRAAKGNEKYGKDGMKALAKAGREGASEKKLDTIRDKHDNYNEDSDPCWDSHKMVGTKKKAGKTVPNCVPKESLAEGFNGEYDDEAGMAQSNLLSTARAVTGLLKTIKDRDNLPEWGQEKIAKAEMMLVSVWDYLQSQKELGNDPQVEGYGRYDRRDAYQRDYDHSVAGMDRGNNHRDDERHDLDPSDWYIVKDGKMFAVSVYPNQEQEAMARGYSRTRDEAKAKASKQGVAEGLSKRDQQDVAAIKAAIERLQAQLKQPNADRDAIQQSIAHEKKRLALYGEQGVAEIDTYIESLAESLQEVLSEKAVSKKQQKFMGMVHAAQKGEKPASKEVAKVAKDMGKKDAKDFASTKHKGLPEKKKAKK